VHAADAWEAYMNDTADEAQRAIVDKQQGGLKILGE
jgi:hypothetical protein